MKTINICFIFIMILHTIHGIKKDIVIVLDRSGSLTTEEVNDAIEFIYNVTSYLDIGTNDIQLSLISYSDDVKTEFTFTDFIAKNDLLSAIKNLTGLPTGGSTYTFNALNYVLTDVFTPSAGARADAQKTVIVMTDGASSNLLATTDSADTIRSNLSAEIFAVAIGDDPDPDEINGIANDPDTFYVHSASSFLYLCNLIPAIVPKLDTTAVADLAADCPIDPEAPTTTSSPLDNTYSSRTLLSIFAAVLSLILLFLLLLCCFCFMKKKKRKHNGKTVDVYLQIENTPTHVIEAKPVRRELSILSHNGWTSGMDKNKSITESKPYSLNRESTNSLNSVLYRDMFQFNPQSKATGYI